MTYRPIGTRKIIESLFNVYCGFRARHEEEIAKELAHLNVKLQESFENQEGKAVSAGYLAAQSFFIGKEYAESINNGERRTK